MCPRLAYNVSRRALASAQGLALNPGPAAKSTPPEFPEPQFPYLPSGPVDLFYH